MHFMIHNYQFEFLISLVLWINIIDHYQHSHSILIVLINMFPYCPVTMDSIKLVNISLIVQSKG